MFNRIKKLLQNLFVKNEKATGAEASAVSEAPLIHNQSPVHSNREDDHSAEAQLNIFLDKYLYARFPTGNSFSAIRRTQDKSEQLSGVDVEFTGTDGRVYFVDEKAQLHYLNQNLPTFAFELLSYQKGYDTVGWLCNEKLKTDFYMLIWPFATQDSYKGITHNQFTRVDCLLIQKQKLLKMLDAKGLTVERMMEDAYEIRRNGKTGKITIPGIRGIYYYASQSYKYKEAPINIVISKQLLKALAQRRYIVTTEKVTTE